ncbi:MAG: energy-coupled thiamine transporter ThiT [Clostridiales bacterium]|nr:energy-coupled thiamine transporter ThiT [Clostridiales bacterium]
MFDFGGVLIPWWQLVLLLVAVAAVLALLYLFFRGYEKKREKTLERGRTRDLTFGAACLAVSYALSFIPMLKMPWGGTVTPASALPLLLFCYYFGFRKSLAACFAYALLQLLQNPYIVSPWSALLDYILPFMAISLAGLFSFKKKNYTRALARMEDAYRTAAEPPEGKWRRFCYKTSLFFRTKGRLLRAHLPFLAGVGLYFIARLSSHVLAGILFWWQGVDLFVWQGDVLGMAAFWYSLTYNVLYLVPDTAIALALGVAVLMNKAFNAFMAKTVYTKQNADARAKDEERAGARADEGEREPGGRDGAGYDGNVDQHLYADEGGDSAG